MDQEMDEFDYADYCSEWDMKEFDQEIQEPEE